MDGCGLQRRPLAPGSSRLDRAIIGWMEYVVIALSFGLATAIIGKAKGSSFFIWLAVGTVLPLLGLIAVILYRSEKTEPERRCPRCGAVHKLYVQVCARCGEDLYLPDPKEARPPRRGPHPPPMRTRERASVASSGVIASERERSNRRE